MPCAGKEPSSALQKVAQQTFFPYTPSNVAFTVRKVSV
jgi:hypothetical protein